MADVAPLKGLRPKPEIAARLIAPPYDVLDAIEARELARGKPESWLHVSKPEIDLDPEIDHYDERVYAKARENYRAFLKRGYFLEELAPVYYGYRLSVPGHSQTGIIAGAAVAEYEQGLIKKHELTRADKEQDRTRHTEHLLAHTGPVFLVHRQSAEIDQLVAATCATEPVYDITTADGVRNEVWVMAETRALRQAFAAVPCLYIADGHHRAASYCRVGASLRNAAWEGVGSEPFQHFLAVIFPHNQMRIMAYNRVVAGLNGLAAGEFLRRVAEKFEVTETAPATPAERHEISMFLEGRWRNLKPRPGSFAADNPVRSLDVSILQENLLAPVLGIADPRRDQRIDFVGGIRGTGELERRVKEGASQGRVDVAFSLHPTGIEELMTIADAGEIMPPKSTWFEPKLKDGFVIHRVGRL